MWQAHTDGVLVVPGRLLRSSLGGERLRILPGGLNVAGRQHIGGRLYRKPPPPPALAVRGKDEPSSDSLGIYLRGGAH